MNKQKTLNSILNTTCRIQPSPIQGVGVFAIRDIEKDENPFIDEEETKWVKISKKEFSNSSEEVKKLIKAFFVEEGNSIWVNKGGFYTMGLSFYTNHSKNPNLISIDTKNGTTFRTKRKILKGEELLSNYTEFDEEKHAYID
ncbi:MAG: SET domain-containing protein [archaeon]|jgi:SET domain-containing protein